MSTHHAVLYRVEGLACEVPDCDNETSRPVEQVSESSACTELRLTEYNNS